MDSCVMKCVMVCNKDFRQCNKDIEMCRDVQRCVISHVMKLCKSVIKGSKRVITLCNKNLNRVMMCNDV